MMMELSFRLDDSPFATIAQTPCGSHRTKNLPCGVLLIKRALGFKALICAVCSHLQELTAFQVKRLALSDECCPAVGRYGASPTIHEMTSASSHLTSSICFLGLATACTSICVPPKPPSTSSHTDEHRLAKHTNMGSVKCISQQLQLNNFELLLAAVVDCIACVIESIDLNLSASAKFINRGLELRSVAERRMYFDWNS